MIVALDSVPLEADARLVVTEWAPWLVRALPGPAAVSDSPTTEHREPVDAERDLRLHGTALTASVAEIADTPGTVCLAAGPDRGRPDRIDLIVALTLLACGAGVSTVIDDYRAAGGTESASFMAAMSYLDTIGGPHAWLLRHGMRPDQLVALRDRAVDPGETLVETAA